jgi:predicted Rossmann fold flavoprotein
VKPETDVIVIGGGPAGLTAARAAALRGLSVLMLERNPRCAKKLLITGKGRCNVTNAAGREEMFSSIVTNPRFLYSALSRFGAEDIRALLTEAGVPTKVERGGRVFPESDRAFDVAQALERSAREAGVKIRCEARVRGIRTSDGAVRAVELSDGQALACRCAILCTGGMSYPLTGSTGDGYRMAQALGHTVTPLRPALVPIVLKDPYIPRLEGVSLRNVRLRLRRGGKTVVDELGELVFTRDGVSGPLALSASSLMTEDPEGYQLTLDLKPGLDGDKLDKRLLRDFEAYSNKQFKNALGDLLLKKLIPVVIELSGIDPLRPVHQISRSERARLSALLKGWTLRPARLGHMDEAIVTAGGVRVKEVDPAAMESKIVRNLHFAGEILDVDALTGGYNLTIAFSTGHAAGTYCLMQEG